MSEQVEVKKVGTQSIVLEETTVVPGVGAMVAFIVVCSMAILMIGTIVSFGSDIPVTLGLLVVITVGAIVIIALVVKSSPAYTVHILGDTTPKIHIIKTAPEKDQIAICKAVQEFESKAREIEKKRRELESIGAKCR